MHQLRGVRGGSSFARVEEVRNEFSRLGGSAPSVIAHSRPDHLSCSYHTSMTMSNVPPPYAPRDHAQGQYIPLIGWRIVADA